MSAFVSPKPSYHLCPDFSIPPPPDGQLELGSILTSLDIEGVTSPLNHLTCVKVPEDDLYPRGRPDVKVGFQRTMSQLRSVEAGIWAKIFGLDGVGGKLGWLRRRSDDETLTVKELKTRYFVPTEKYMLEALTVPNVASFINSTNKEEPLYMVTGIKCAVGASLSNIKSKKTQGTADIGAVEPNSGTAVGGALGITREDSSGAAFSESTDFVLGIRLRKIWWKGGVMRHATHVAGSALDDEGQGRAGPLVGVEFIDDFNISDGQGGAENVFIDEEGLGGMEPSVWILP
ncbi:hypothetical protein ACHAQA_006959 [Verticillium albo-atrum]